MVGGYILQNHQCCKRQRKTVKSSILKESKGTPQQNIIPDPSLDPALQKKISTNDMIGLIDKTGIWMTN